MAQGYNARLDESLGERRGKESSKMQSYKDRRDESRGTRDRSAPHRSEDRGGGKFNLQDNVQAPTVKTVNTNSEQYDLGRVQKYTCGSKGYPAEAWNYDY